MMSSFIKTPKTDEELEIAINELLYATEGRSKVTLYYEEFYNDLTQMKVSVQIFTEDPYEESGLMWTKKSVDPFEIEQKGKEFFKEQIIEEMWEHFLRTVMMTFGNALENNLDNPAMSYTKAKSKVEEEMNLMLNPHGLTATLEENDVKYIGEPYNQEIKIVKMGISDLVEGDNLRVVKVDRMHGRYVDSERWNRGMKDMYKEVKSTLIGDMVKTYKEVLKDKIKEHNEKQSN